ncbi:MAG TPA: hypothetical protein VKN18_13870 [Blastocatellia bacterium]|nr:hypothetical protein [Blastocatellia bacterium]
MRSRTRITLLFCLLAFIPARLALAQEIGSETGVARAENLEMVVRAGFGRLSVSSWTGSWVPFRINITNQGPALTGRLIVHCESSPNPNPQVREYVKDIQLPTGSRQLHEIAAFLNSGEAPVVRFETDDQVIAETRISVERSNIVADQLEIAVVDTDSTTLNNIASAEVVRAPNRAPFKKPGSTAGSIPDSSPQPPPQSVQNRRGGFPGQNFGRPFFQAHPVVIAAEDLPREFISYDQLDALVIGDSPLNQLSEDQARALRLWVASGGLLVVTGAADMAGLRAIGLEPLLPVESQSTAMVDSLSDLNDVYGSFDSGDRLTMLVSRVKPDAYRLIGTIDRPIIAEIGYGSGLVRFVAINPKLNPYRAWAAAKNLWVDVLLPAAETKPKQINWITVGRRGTSSSNRWGIQSFLFRLAQVAPPTPKYVLLFLLAYALSLGPLNYLILRWRRKTELAWLTIPAVVLLFAGVSVVVAQVGRGGTSIVADTSLVEVHQREGVSRVSSGLLVMPATKSTHEIEFEGRDTYVNDVYNGNQTSSASAIGNIECERGVKDFVLRVPMTTWTFGLFQLRSIKEGVAPMISVSDANAGSITIRNLADAAINRAVYLSPEGISDLVDVGPGELQRLSISAPEPIAFSGWYLARFPQGSEEAELLQEVVALLDKEIGGDPAIAQGFFGTQLMSESLKRLSRPLLIGFVDKGATGIGFHGSMTRRSKALYVVHL